MSGELKVVGRVDTGARILAKLNALGAAGAAFTDSVFAIKGSSDATKKLRFEVDGFTTSTTRVATFPNADITVASINVAQTFTAAQTYSSTATFDTSSTGITLSKLTGTLITVASTAAASVTTAGGYTSTVATGTAPFTATSTTVCPNLNASLLVGGTWAIPGSIGSTTPAAGAFTTLSASSTLAVTGTSTFTGAAGFGGGAVSTFSPLAVQGFSGITGTTATGMFVNATAPTTATSAIRGAQFSLAGAASTTHGEATGFLCGGITPGAGGTLTRVQSAWLSPQTGSSTNSCGLLISSAMTYTGAWAIRSESTDPSSLAGALTLTTASSGLTISITTGTSLVVSSTAATCATFGGGVTIAGTFTITGKFAITSAGASTFTYSDAGTTNAPAAQILDRRTSGTPAAGFGIKYAVVGQSDTTVGQDLGSLVWSWATATHASRKSRFVVNVSDASDDREVLRGEASGSAPMIGLLGASATAREAVTGSRGGNAALADLLTKLATKGMITDSTSA